MWIYSKEDMVNVNPADVVCVRWGMDRESDRWQVTIIYSDKGRIYFPCETDVEAIATYNVICNGFKEGLPYINILM